MRLDFLDVDCNIAEVMILSFKSCESILFSNLIQRDCPSVLLEDKQNASYSKGYVRFTEEWSVCLARGSCRGDEGLSIDGSPLPSVDGDARIWLGEKRGTPSESSWNSIDPPVRFRVQIGYEGLAPTTD
ncbi:hypothetical protein YC2023_059549 [Brassica napus]